MRTQIRLFSLSLLLLLFFSCSTRKDAFLNRNFHSLTTKYNVLYNGKLAFEKGLNEISSKYEDDFWSVLPLEPIEFLDNTIPAPKLLGPGVNAPKGNADDNQQLLL